MSSTKRKLFQTPYIKDNKINLQSKVIHQNEE